MNKFEFHLLTAFYDYFKEIILKRDVLLAISLKERLEVLLNLCNEKIERTED